VRGSFYNSEVVKVSRRVSRWIVVAATLAAAVWLYTYRVAATVEYIDRYGNRFHPSEHVRVQPWWSVYATVALIFVGAGVSLWFLPSRGRLIERFAKVLGPARSPDAL
jgi:membrane protein YdbS with pleckstrin-like domain